MVSSKKMQNRSHAGLIVREACYMLQAQCVRLSITDMVRNGEELQSTSMSEKHKKI